MEFIEELQKKYIVGKGLAENIASKFDPKHLETTAETLGFEKPNMYLTRHTPKKGKDKGKECVYLVTNGHWERLCQGKEVDKEAIRKKFEEVSELATALACLL